jgi:hypothetical protein
LQFLPQFSSALCCGSLVLVVVGGGGGVSCVHLFWFRVVNDNKRVQFLSGS